MFPYQVLIISFVWIYVQMDLCTNGQMDKWINMEAKKEIHIKVDADLHKWFKQKALDVGASMTVLIELQMNRYKTEMETRKKWEESRNKKKK